jgi:hypothetical protein
MRSGLGLTRMSHADVRPERTGWWLVGVVQLVAAGHRQHHELDCGNMYSRALLQDNAHDPGGKCT